MLTYSITKQVTDDELRQFVAAWHPEYSPWFRIVIDEDGVTVRYDLLDGLEGNLDGEREFSWAEVAAGFGDAAREEQQALCCLDVMLHDGLQYGCAEDLDATLQVMVFDKLVYG